MIHNLNRLKMFAFLTTSIVAISTIVTAQDPGSPVTGPGTQPVTQPAAPASAGGDFVLVSSGGTRQLAEDYIAKKGWNLGWDIDKSWGVWIGDSTLLAAHPTGLSLGMLDAALDAKFQYAEYLAGVTESLTLRTSIKNPEQRTKERNRLDVLAKGPGGDPVAAGIKDLLDSTASGEDVTGIAFRTRITSASKTSAQTAIPGMIVAATFVQTDAKGLDGIVSVVVISTPNSRKMADALLGRGPTVIGASKESTKDFVNGLSPEALVYSTGATTRFNDKGEMCLLGFGVGSVDGTQAEEQRFARDEATEVSTASIRSIAGEWIEGSRLLLKTAEKTKWVDGKVESTSAKAQELRIAAIAKGLQMPGVVTILEKTFDHPKLGRLVCIVREWNLSQAKNAAWWREKLLEQGGWKGGDGVQPEQPGSTGSYTQPTVPSTKSVPSGSGGAGADE